MSDKPKTFEEWQAKQFHTGGKDAEIHAERAWDFRDGLAKEEVETARQEMQAEIDRLKERLDEISRYTGGYLYKGEMWSAYIYSVVHNIDFRESEKHFIKELNQFIKELNQGNKDGIHS